jgi:hypothetical protein
MFRDEDFSFVLSGISRLLMNPLLQTYLPYSQRKVGVKGQCYCLSKFMKPTCPTHRER